MARARAIAAATLTVAVLAGCAGATGTADAPDSTRAPVVAPAGAAASPDPTSKDPSAEHPAPQRPAPRSEPLRPGERFVDIRLPEAYTPSAPTGVGTDDYRCFLIDPELGTDQLVSGVDIRPDNLDLVHHVIVSKVLPDQVGRARELDAADPGPGWTCFGGSGVRGGGPALDDADWVGAWAPGGGERVMAEDIGIPLVQRSRLVVQMHYNLRGGQGSDRSTVRLRLSEAANSTKKPLATLLFPTPVELPCREGATTERLCVRDLAVADVVQRFGEDPARANLLHLICGPLDPGPTQSCTRTVREAGTIRSAAGHMHLLGREITIDVTRRGDGPTRRVLDIPVWDFDDQAGIPLEDPMRVRPGDQVTVTCRHDQSLRDLLPAFEGQPERYVVWGEGTTDEMCLGILMMTRP